MWHLRKKINVFFEDPDPENQDPDPENQDPDPEPKDEKFTQTQVNTFLKKEKDKHIQQLNDLKEDKTLSDQQVAKLEEQIQSLESEGKSQLQVAQGQVSTLKKEKKELSKQLESDNNVWKKRFEDQLIDTQILTAATDPDHKAYNSNQLLSMLRPSAKVVERKGENGEASTFDVLIDVKALKDEEETILTLSPKEGIAEMAKHRQMHGNLFESGTVPGLGAAPGKGINQGSPPKDPEEYIKWRADNELED